MVRETSLMAYCAEMPKIRETQYRVLYSLWRHGPMTASELALLLQERINAISPRPNELRKMGLVHGLRKRSCSVTTHTAIEWSVTTKGMHAIEQGEVLS
jgi:DNA-binding MarR family transcriptional regulator